MEGIEKIKKLAEELKENVNIQMVVEYLINREDMNDKYLSDEKNLKDMWNYIIEEARKKQKDGATVMKDEEVYSLAIHYFDETNESLGIKIKKNAEKPVKENIEKDNKKINKEAEDNKINNDNDIAMIFRGQKVTFKELREGTYLKNTTSQISL